MNAELQAKKAMLRKWIIQERVLACFKTPFAGKRVSYGWIQPTRIADNLPNQGPRFSRNYIDTLVRSGFLVAVGGSEMLDFYKLGEEAHA